MASFNSCTFVGNLTRDPELTYTPGNTALCKFGLAMNSKYRDKKGRVREVTWIRHREKHAERYDDVVCWSPVSGFGLKSRGGSLFAARMMDFVEVE